MTPLDGQPILTAAAMRAAEDDAIAAGSSVEELMDRAGSGVAAAVRRLSAGAPVLILCGPGNNGGDGYVVARRLLEAGHDVRVAALGEPKGDAAKAVRDAWNNPVEAFAEAGGAPILVDCLFGTGLSRALDPGMATRFAALTERARLSIAVDLPSGVATDTGEMFGTVPHFDVTLALGAGKPSHLLEPAASHCGQIRVIDIGIAAQSTIHAASSPDLPAPGPDSHKYSRGMAAIVAGAMPGAAALASEAAMRAGAGYALLLTDRPATGLPHAVVQRGWSPDALDDPRIGAVIVGPGLGREGDARIKLDAAIAGGHALVIDGDALHLLDKEDFRGFAARSKPVMLTPHGGEFAALFGQWSGSKIDAARKAAASAGATIVFKGADTVIASPDGQCVVHRAGSPWLSTAGTGDVLAGAIGAVLAATGRAFDAATAGVWMHGKAARRLSGAFVADDLVRELSAVRASL